jgi:lambda repressor-like predicted transcriptional regulator
MRRVQQTDFEKREKGCHLLLAIRKFRRQECEHVGTVCKDVMGIIVAMIWESRFSDQRIWRF